MGERQRGEDYLVPPVSTRLPGLPPQLIPPSVQDLLAPPVMPARYRVYCRASHMEASGPYDLWCLDGDSIQVDASDQVTILAVVPARPGDVR